MNQMIRNIRRFYTEHIVSITDKEKEGSWAQFFDRKRFSLPSNLTDAIANRCPLNLQIFFKNYCTISVMLLVYCLITSPLLLIGLIVFSIIFYAILKKNQPVLVPFVHDKTLSRNEQLILLCTIAIPVLYVLGLTTIFFWLVGASTFVIALHSAFHIPSKIVKKEIDEEDVVPTSVVVTTASPVKESDSSKEKSVPDVATIEPTVEEHDTNHHDDIDYVDDDDDDDEDDDHKNAKINKQDDNKKEDKKGKIKVVKKKNKIIPQTPEEPESVSV